MAANKYAAIRYRIIDRCIRSRSKPFPSKEDLRQKCEEELFGTTDGSHISISTIEKDLWAMKNEAAFGYAPIKYAKIENGYYYENPDFSFNLPLTEEDISIIRIAASTLVHFKNTELFSELENAIDKISNRLRIANQIQRDEIKAIEFESVPWYRGSEYLEPVLRAIQNKQLISLKYLPFYDAKLREYAFEPYLLKEYKNRWYLVGKDKTGNKLRTLGLDRIRDIQMMNASFPSPDDFSTEEFFKHSFGISVLNKKPEKILLSFDPVQGQYLKTQSLHKSQEIVLENDTEVRVSLFVIVSHELIMQILSYGKQVKVMSPDHLKKQIVDILESSLDKYQ